MAFLIKVPLYSQSSYKVIPITSLDPDWTYVAGGDVIAFPIKTNQGYLYLLEGKMAITLTSKGNLVWQKGFKSKLKPLSAVNADNITYIASGSKNLTLLNPEGTEIWTINTGSEIKENPITGRDGRVFVRNPKGLACYGTKGKCKWSVNIDNQNFNIPVTLLDDGSLLIFTTTKTASGTTVAKHLSPFGQVLDNIYLDGQINKIHSTPKGILVYYLNGDISLLCVKDNTLSPKWTISKDVLNAKGSVSFVYDEINPSVITVIHGSYANMITIDADKGKILNRFQSNIVKTENIKYAGSTLQGFIVADNTDASCFDSEGLPLWTLNYSGKKRWNYIFATDEGDIVFCTKDWTIEAYHVNREITAKQKTKTQAIKRSDYSSLYSAPTLSRYTDQTYKDIYKKLLDGNYGPQESEWMNYLQTELNAIYMDYNKTSGIKARGDTPYYQGNIQTLQQIFNLTGAMESTEFQKSIVLLLKEIEDPTVLSILIRQCGHIGYDYNYNMLNCFETVIQKKTVKKDQELIEAICDATYEICLYMGSGALNYKGKDIISYMLYPQFDEKAKNYARLTMQKLSSIK